MTKSMPKSTTAPGWTQHTSGTVKKPYAARGMVTFAHGL